jgi:hypothetical protein
VRKPLSGNAAFATMAIASATAFLLVISACAARSRADSLSSARRPSRVEITRDGDTFTVTLARQDETWSLLVDTARAYPTNAARVASFLGALSASKQIVRVASGKGSDYGIGIAGSYRVTVTGERADGGSERLFFGDTDVTGEWVYFSRAGDGAVFRAPSGIVPFLDVRASSWAELSPYRLILTSCDVQEIDVVGGPAYRAGTDSRVEKFGASLKGLTAIDITNFARAPEFTVRVTFGDARQATLGFAQLDGDWILSDGATGLSYVISGTSMRELFASLDVSDAPVSY